MKILRISSEWKGIISKLVHVKKLVHVLLCMCEVILKTFFVVFDPEVVRSLTSMNPESDSVIPHNTTIFMYVSSVFMIKEIFFMSKKSEDAEKYENGAQALCSARFFSRRVGANLLHCVLLAFFCSNAS